MKTILLFNKTDQCRLNIVKDIDTTATMKQSHTVHHAKVSVLQNLVTPLPKRKAITVNDFQAQAKDCFTKIQKNNPL